MKVLWGQGLCLSCLHCIWLLAQWQTWCVLDTQDVCVNWLIGWADEGWVGRARCWHGGILDIDAYVLLSTCTFVFPSFLPVNVSCESPYRFRCDNNRCIYKHELCNHVDDCGDGSDEKEEQCKQKWKRRGKTKGPKLSAVCKMSLWDFSFFCRGLDLRLQISIDNCWQTYKHTCSSYVPLPCLCPSHWSKSSNFLVFV